MTNTNEIRDNVLGYISAIEDVALESEMAVTLSLMEAADKAMMIMENYEGDYIDSFSVFQEAAGDEKDPKHPFKEDGLLKTIIMAPINLIKLIIAKLKKLFGKEEQTKLQKAGDVLKDLGKTGIETFNSVCELLSGHKTEAVVLGTTITAGTALVISGKAKQAYDAAVRFTEKYLQTWMKNGTDKLKKDSYNPKLVLVDGKPAIETPINFVGLTKWLTDTIDALDKYNMSLIKPGSAKDVPGGRTGDHEKIIEAVRKVSFQVKEIKQAKGFVSLKRETITVDEFRNLFGDAETKLDQLETDVKDAGIITPEKENPYYKELMNAARDFTDNSLSIQKTVVNLQEGFGAYSKYINATADELSAMASKKGKSIVEFFKDLVSKKKGDDADADAASSEGTKQLTGSARPALGMDKTTINPGDGMGSPKLHDDDIDTTVPGNESAKISIVDEDYIQEGVTRTGKTVKVEETAKTAADVEKLIKKYVSNVAKRGFNNDQKILLVIGDSKIQYDKGGIKKPGKGETWDDVDMSAHDHVDKVKLYVSGPGALAYAKDNNIGKSKQVQEAALPEENEVEETVTVGSADTSWYN